MQIYAKNLSGESSKQMFNIIIGESSLTEIFFRYYVVSYILTGLHTNIASGPDGIPLLVFKNVLQSLRQTCENYFHSPSRPESYQRFGTTYGCSQFLSRGIRHILRAVDQSNGTRSP